MVILRQHQMKNLLFLSALLFTGIAAAQVIAPPDGTVLVHFSVYDLEDSTAVIAPMVINKSSGKGMMGSTAQPLKMRIKKTDTLSVTSGGYSAVRVCLKDSSVTKSEFKLRIGLKLKLQKLPAVSIYPAKELEQIKKEREKLGVKYHYQTEAPMEALGSPITALYERFSKKEQSKQLVARLENEDRMRDVLKDLFRVYVKADVIELSEDEFDKFILFLNLPEEFLRKASEYELAAAIKERYVRFRELEKIHRRSQN